MGKNFIVNFFFCYNIYYWCYYDSDIYFGFDEIIKYVILKIIKCVDIVIICSKDVLREVCLKLSKFKLNVLYVI